MSFSVMEKLRTEAWDKFSALSLFFVNASELMYLIPTTPHLHNVKLTMAYRELPDGLQPLRRNPQKWKSDPDSQHSNGFAPRNKYYLNGALVGQEKPRLAQVSKTPFPENRVPRRGGLVAVRPEDPDYAALCSEQGLQHLLTENPFAMAANGVHDAGMPLNVAANGYAFASNNLHSPPQQGLPAVNGNGHVDAMESTTSMLLGAQSLVNGVNGVNGLVNGGARRHVRP
jgi:hypothetical protein